MYRKNLNLLGEIIMVRKSNTNTILAFFLIFVMVLSSLSVVSSDAPESYNENDVGETDYGQSVISTEIQVRVVEGVEESQEWSYEIKACVGDILRFRITMENQRSKEYSR